MGAEAGRRRVVGPRKKRWGTWEELILGGAVTRHGTQDWNVVASELRTRTLRPHLYSPQACRARFDDVMKRYSSSYAWFDELRKVRMAELKRELEKSEESIRSLESKMRSLEKKPSNKAGCRSIKTESPAPVMSSDGNKSSPKETSKDRLSARSFSHNAVTSWSLHHQAPALVSSEGTDIKQENENSESVGQMKRGGGTLKKQRGKRKRKDCSLEAKEGSIGDSDNLGSNVVVSSSICKETSTSGCDQIQPMKFVGRDGDEKGTSQTANDDLIGIFNSISEHRVASVFRHRLDGQKRARYKKIIRQHVDFETIRSRVSTCSIRSAKELFRDLLLLANNAMVFYSKRTREYKSGAALRDIVMKAYRAHYKPCNNKATSSASFPLAPSLYNPPGKPRSARPRPCKPKVSASKFDNAQNIAASATSLKVQPKISVKSENAKKIAAGAASPKVQPPKPSDVDHNVSLQPLLKSKKGLKCPVNGSSNPWAKNQPAKMDRRRGQQK